MADTEQLTAIARQWLSQFASALYTANPTAVAATFQQTGWFRDVLTFSWDNRTLEGREKISFYLSDKLTSTKVLNIKLNDDPLFRPVHFAADPVQGVEFGYTFETPIALGQGFVKLLQDSNGEWKGHIVSMILMDIKGHEEPTKRYSFEEFVDGKTWGQYTSEQRASIEADPYVIIIGAGQIGLQVAARFKQMNIPCIVVERNKRVGDNWRKRYSSLALHTIKEQHQLLYQPHPSNWPVYPPRDRVANMLETYAITQELIVWTNSSPVGRPVYDHGSHRWAITIDRDGQEVALHPGHIILATGTLGAPKIPQIRDRDRFLGTVIHATQYNEPSPYIGKEVVVVGAGNTSIDICQDLVQAGAKSVTMIQRSSTCISAREVDNARIAKGFPPEVPVQVCDFKIASVPRGYVVRTSMEKEALRQYWEASKSTLDKLKKGGVNFNLEKPQVVLWLEKMGGYWLDKGGADLIASGAIKVKTGIEPKAFTDKGVLFTDGSEIMADTVIFATGYINIREVNRQVFGPEVIDRTHEVWGMDSEGEISGCYRPSGYPGLWYAAGDFTNGRFQSKHLAIQIKAIQLGLLTQS